MSSKSVVQECQVRVSEKSVSQARMSHKIVKSECPRRGSSKKGQVRSVSQERLARVARKSVKQEVSYKSVK